MMNQPHPEEILCHVLSFLDELTLFSVVRLVSRPWKRMGEQELRKQIVSNLPFSRAESTEFSHARPAWRFEASFSQNHPRSCREGAVEQALRDVKSLRQAGEIPLVDQDIRQALLATGHYDMKRPVSRHKEYQLDVSVKSIREKGKEVEEAKALLHKALLLLQQRSCQSFSERLPTISQIHELRRMTLVFVWELLVQTETSAVTATFSSSCCSLTENGGDTKSHSKTWWALCFSSCDDNSVEFWFREEKTFNYVAGLI